MSWKNHVVLALFYVVELTRFVSISWSSRTRVGNGTSLAVGARDEHFVFSSRYERFCTASISQVRWWGLLSVSTGCKAVVSSQPTRRTATTARFTTARRGTLQPIAETLSVAPCTIKIEELCWYEDISPNKASADDFPRVPSTTYILNL